MAFFYVVLCFSSKTALIIDGSNGKQRHLRNFLIVVSFLESAVAVGVFLLSK